MKSIIITHRNTLKNLLFNEFQMEEDMTCLLMDILCTCKRLRQLSRPTSSQNMDENCEVRLDSVANLISDLFSAKPAKRSIIFQTGISRRASSSHTREPQVPYNVLCCDYSRQQHWQHSDRRKVFSQSRNDYLCHFSRSRIESGRV